VKRLAVFSLVVLVFAGCSKPLGGLDGFLDIPWGASVETAARVLGEKGYTWTAEDDAIKAEGKFTGIDAELSLDFFDGRFYAGRVDFPSKKSETDYNEYVALVTEKYGKSFNTWKSVLDTSDKRKLTMKSTTWNFDNSASITVHYSSSLSGVWVSYQDDELNSRVSAIREEQKKEQAGQEKLQKEQESQTALNDL
jgi:hypothetical protein